MKIHAFIQHIEERVETDLRVWRYLLPPREEQQGHEIQGTLPIWQPVTPTDHFICQTGNKQNKHDFYFFSLQKSASNVSLGTTLSQ